MTDNWRRNCENWKLRYDKLIKTGEYRVMQKWRNGTAHLYHIPTGVNYRTKSWRSKYIIDYTDDNFITEMEPDSRYSKQELENWHKGINYKWGYDKNGDIVELIRK